MGDSEVQRSAGLQGMGPGPAPAQALVLRGPGTSRDLSDCPTQIPFLYLSSPCFGFWIVCYLFPVLDVTPTGVKLGISLTEIRVSMTMEKVRPKPCTVGHQGSNLTFLHPRPQYTSNTASGGGNKTQNGFEILA